MEERKGGANVMAIQEGVTVNGITASEAAKFETLFNLLDDDGDGCIDEEKLADLMPRLGVFQSEEELHVLFTAVDEDGSGALDFLEFLQLMARYREENQLALLEGGRECFQRLRSASKFANIARADDPINWFGDTLYLVMIFFHISVVLYEDLLWRDVPHAGAAIKSAFAALALLDIARGLYTARPPRESDTLPVDNFRATRSQYLRSRRFIYDVVGAAPLDIIFMYLGMSTEMRIAQHLRLVKILRFGDVYQRTPRDLISSLYARYLFSIVPLIYMAFWAMLSVHVLSVLWMVMSDSDYITSMYFIVYTLTTTGLGDVHVTSDGEKLFCCGLFCCASVVSGLVAGKLVRLNQQADLEYDANRRMLETLAAIDHLNVPHNFKQEVLAFQLHRLKHSNSLFNDAISGLPELMQERMALYARMKVVRVVPIFQTAPEICVAKLAQSLVTVFVPPEEYIIIAGEEGEEMFFLFYGMCSVADKTGAHVAIVKRGGVFGEIALLEQGSRRACSVKTLTYCQLFRLDRIEFDKIVEAFPALLESIMQASKALRMQIMSPRHRKSRIRRVVVDDPSPGQSPLTSPRRSRVGDSSTKVSGEGEMYSDICASLGGDADEMDGGNDNDNNTSGDDDPIFSRDITRTSPGAAYLLNGRDSGLAAPAAAPPTTASSSAAAVGDHNTAAASTADHGNAHSGNNSSAKADGGGGGIVRGGVPLASQPQPHPLQRGASPSANPTPPPPLPPSTSADEATGGGGGAVVGAAAPPAVTSGTLVSDDGDDPGLPAADVVDPRAPPSLIPSPPPPRGLVPSVDGGGGGTDTIGIGEHANESGGPPKAEKAPTATGAVDGTPAFFSPPQSTEVDLPLQIPRLFIRDASSPQIPTSPPLASPPDHTRLTPRAILPMVLSPTGVPAPAPLPSRHDRLSSVAFTTTEDDAGIISENSCVPLKTSSITFVAGTSSPEPMGRASPSSPGPRRASHRRSVVFRESMLQEAARGITRARGNSLDSDASSNRGLTRKESRRLRRMQSSRRTINPELERYNTIIDKLDQVYRGMVQLERVQVRKRSMLDYDFGRRQSTTETDGRTTGRSDRMSLRGSEPGLTPRVGEDHGEGGNAGTSRECSNGLPQKASGG